MKVDAAQLIQKTVVRPELQGEGSAGLRSVRLKRDMGEGCFFGRFGRELCEEGGAVDFFNSGAAHRDGRLPVNVSGGLQSKGHPISATGIANIWEVCQHLRNEGGPRQIEGAKVGLAHVIGLGSACGVHVLERSALAAA